MPEAPQSMRNPAQAAEHEGLGYWGNIGFQAVETTEGTLGHWRGRLHWRCPGRRVLKAAEDFNGSCEVVAVGTAAMGTHW